MEFATEAQKACYEKVAAYLKEIFGEMAIARDDRPAFAVSTIAMGGSAIAQIAVLPWGDDDATITVRAYVVTDVALTPELMEYLLKLNNEKRFGAFGVDEENDIFFEHTIVGSTCDKEELKASIAAVLFTADEYDDQIRSRWGGMRALDSLSS